MKKISFFILLNFLFIYSSAAGDFQDLLDDGFEIMAISKNSLYLQNRNKVFVCLLDTWDGKTYVDTVKECVLVTDKYE